MTACAMACATCPKGQAAGHVCRDPRRRFRPEVKRRIMIGTYVLSAGFYDAYYTQAQKVRTLIARDFDRAFEKCDCCSPRPRRRRRSGWAKRGRSAGDVSERRVHGARERSRDCPRCRCPAALDAQGLPLGLQIIGKALDEQSVLNAGLAIEERAASRRGRRSGGKMTISSWQDWIAWGGIFLPLATLDLVCLAVCSASKAQ
jgi:Asp-tRNA(Asn)/Glu-tRNA(Gln) amidotransferase A subunit family amidase